MGKGDWQRKSNIPPDVVRANWDRIFTEREKKPELTGRIQVVKGRYTIQTGAKRQS